jgi:acyl-CoA dehydrogenase
MNILLYSEEHKIFRDSLNKFFTKEVIPYADDWEEMGIVPREAWKKMGKQGFLCMQVPKEYGGCGTDFLYSVIVIEELIRTRQFGLLAPLHSDIVVPYLLSFGNDDQKNRYLPGCVAGDIITAVAMTEPNTGSDLAAIRTTAVEDGDCVVINGQKTFISNGINCDLVVLAVRDPKIKNPHLAMDLFLVEAGTPGFDKGKRIKKVGWHSQDTAELYFSNCRVPLANRLGVKGDGFSMLMQKLQQERLVISIMALAMAEEMLRLTIMYCQERKAFGKSISKFQHNQFKLVEMTAEVKLGRTFVDKLVADHLEEKSTVLDISLAKFWITDMAMRVIDGCVQLYGGYGYCDEYAISRAWRDMRVMSIFAGTNEVMKIVAAKQIGL